MSNTGMRIKERRKEIGMSADELANILGINRSTIFRYEAGDIEKVPAQIIPLLAQALRTTPHYLMGWSSNSSDPAADNLVYKISRLDNADKGKVDAFIDGLLTNDKYKKNTSSLAM